MRSENAVICCHGFVGLGVQEEVRRVDLRELRAGAQLANVRATSLTHQSVARLQCST